MRLIDADALLQRAVSHGWSTPKWVSNIVIEDAPTIEAEPIKHGRWIEIGHPWYECSECGERTAVVNLNGEVVWNYCPNCGARMDEVEE